MYNNEETSYLLSDANHRLKMFLRDIAKNKRHIHPDTYRQAQSLALQYQTELSCASDAREYLRTHQGLIGALITSTDWQSPSFAHTFISQAGRETGKIYATKNDYKRDQHWDAFRYEQSFLKENIDVFIKLPMHVYATTSGMAAFTTILMFLLGEKKVVGKILCGTSIYFENKALLTQLFSDKLIIVDESNTKGVLQAIDIHNPSVVIFDSITNAPDIITPDLTTIIRHLLRAQKETYLVIDNTGLSVQFQPFPEIFGRRTNLRLIQFESLNKYHQFGMDRVTGGIIVAYENEAGKLFDYRAHAGTNITDVAAASLPTPNRKYLAKRLMLHNNNTAFIATALKNWIDQNPHSSFEGISYPGIGSYFTVKFKRQFATISNFKRFVNIALSIAKRHNVNLVNGTSFGLDTTRIYLTAIRSKPNTPFVRIAVGVEDPNPLRDVFIETLKRF